MNTHPGKRQRWRFRGDHQGGLRFSSTVVEAMCRLIRETGVADTAAARQNGVAKATLSRWRHTQAGFAQALAEARAAYRQERWSAWQQSLQAEQARLKGSHWRVKARKLERAFPRDYGAPVRRLQASERSLDLFTMEG